jgi:hypothetical protein
MRSKAITRRRPPQPLVLIPVRDGEYDDEADIREMSAKIQEFLYGVSKGYATYHACALSGCKEEAVLRWLNPKHKNYKPKLHTLFKRARAVFYSKQVDKIANTPDWRAALAWLEKHEEDWNPKTVQINMAALPALRMDSDTVNMLSKAYDERMKKTIPIEPLGAEKETKNDDKEIHT